MIQQLRHAVRSLHRRQPALHAAKPDHADFVPLPQGDEGDQQHRIQAVVELAQSAVHRTHAASAIRHQQDGLIPRLLEVTTHERRTARGGLPVDAGEHIAILIVAQLMKIERRPHAAAFDDAHLLHAVRRGQQGEAHHGFIIRIGANPALSGHAEQPLPKTKRRPRQHMSRREGMLTPADETHLVRQRGVIPGRHADLMRQPIRLRRCREAVKHLQTHDAPHRVRQRQRHLRRHADGETPWHGALAADPAFSRQSEKIEQQHRQQQAAANLPKQGQRRDKARQHRQQEPGDEQLEQSGGGTHEQVNNQTRGASTVFSSEVSRSSTPWPLMATSGATCTRCRSTGSTARFTSAGVM